MAAVRVRGPGRPLDLTWLPGIEVFPLGGPVMEEAIPRTDVHTVDVG